MLLQGSLVGCFIQEVKLRSQKYNYSNLIFEDTPGFRREASVRSLDLCNLLRDCSTRAFETCSLDSAALAL